MDQKIKIYKDLLSTLNPISQKTLRKLFGHLHFIQTLSESNRMNAENLAAVWGPTLLNHPVKTLIFFREIDFKFNLLIPGFEQHRILLKGITGRL